MTRWRSIAILAAFLLAILASADPGFASGAATPSADAGQAYTINDPDVFLYVPANAAHAQPVQVLVAIHGMGGNGPAFCKDLLAAAARNGWLVVAPTFRYQDYKNPDLVLQDDLTFLPRLAALLDGLPARTGLQTRDKVLLYGHSRGAQMAHRFATFYPERVLGVAALSAGSYTLPLRTMPLAGRSRPVPMPFGVADLGTYLGRDFNDTAFKDIPFRIEVGGQDTNQDDVPRAWDPYLGRTRVERAQAYTGTLQAIGVSAMLQVYPDAGHGVSQAMHDDALAFLQGIVGGNAARFGQGLTRGVRASGAIGSAGARH